MTPNEELAVNYLRGRPVGATLTQLLSVIPTNERNALVTLGIMARFGHIVRHPKLRGPAGETLWVLS